MKILDEYGKGRLSVLKEIDLFCKKQGQSAVESKGEDTHKNAHLAGVISAHDRTRRSIKVKIDNLRIL